MKTVKKNHMQSKHQLLLRIPAETLSLLLRDSPLRRPAKRISNRTADSLHVLIRFWVGQALHDDVLVRAIELRILLDAREPFVQSVNARLNHKLKLKRHNNHLPCHVHQYPWRECLRDSRTDSHSLF